MGREVGSRNFGGLSPRPFPDLGGMDCPSCRGKETARRAIAKSARACLRSSVPLRTTMSASTLERDCRCGIHVVCNAVTTRICNDEKLGTGSRAFKRASPLAKRRNRGLGDHASRPPLLGSAPPFGEPACADPSRSDGLIPSPHVRPIAISAPLVGLP